MTMLAQADCPYCGEPIELVVDASAGAQRYVEDCPVCCRPMQVRLQGTHDSDVAEGRVSITLLRDDEA